jgi:hypothetical protein
MQVRNGRDKLMLAVSALAVASVLLAGTYAVNRYDLPESLGDLWVASILFFLVVALSARELYGGSRRGRPITRKWPLRLAWGLLISLHVVLLGSYFVYAKPRWRMSEWIVCLLIELSICAVVLELAYRLATSAGKQYSADRG